MVLDNRDNTFYTKVETHFTGSETISDQSAPQKKGIEVVLSILRLYDDQFGLTDQLEQALSLAKIKTRFGNGLDALERTCDDLFVHSSSKSSAANKIFDALTPHYQDLSKLITPNNLDRFGTPNIPQWRQIGYAISKKFSEKLAAAFLGSEYLKKLKAAPKLLVEIKSTLKEIPKTEMGTADSTAIEKGLISAYRAMTKPDYDRLRGLTQSIQGKKSEAIPKPPETSRDNIDAIENWLELKVYPNGRSGNEAEKSKMRLAIRYHVLGLAFKDFAVMREAQIKTALMCMQNLGLKTLEKQFIGTVNSHGGKYFQIEDGTVIVKEPTLYSPTSTVTHPRSTPLVTAAARGGKGSMGG